MKTNRFAIGASMTSPKTIALTIGMTCYLGASSSPDMVTITTLSDTIVGYETSGRALRIERWIGEDLIVRGCTNKRQQLRDILATDFGKALDRKGDLSAQLAKLDALLG